MNFQYDLLILVPYSSQYDMHYFLELKQNHI
nr:MAG TPA_asm: hypothetical protein [Bacteriophage sp.]